MIRTAYLWIPVAVKTSKGGGRREKGGGIEIKEGKGDVRVSEKKSV